MRARAGQDGVPAARAVRRARTAYGVLSGLVVLGVVGPGLLQRFHAIRSGAPVAGGATALAGALAAELLPFAWRTVGHGAGGARHVTARTLTGLRTVDLDRLVWVRRARVPSRSGWIDALGIKDRAGVGFWFDDTSVARQVAASVRRSSALQEAAVSPVRVSRFASVGLGLAPAPTGARRAARAVTDAVVGLYAPFCAAAVGVFVTWLVTAV